jgi:hypothetical protein
MDLLTTYNTPLRTTSNYSATADLHNSQITTEPAKLFPACCVFTNRSLAAALTVEILQLPMLRSFLRQLQYRTACQEFTLELD